MEYQRPVPSTLKSNPTIHKSIIPVPVASKQGRSTSANEHLNTTTTPSIIQTDLHFQCTQCNEVYKTHSALCAHRRYYHTNQTVHQYASINSSATTNLNTTTPSPTQNNQTIHRCGRCNGEYRCRKILRKHQKTTCQFIFESNESISVLANGQQQQHDSPVAVKQIFKCVQCPSVLSNAFSLKRHIRMIHSGNRKHQPMIPKTYKCIHCPKVYPRGDSLCRHIRINHSGIREQQQQNSVHEAMNESQEQFPVEIQENDDDRHENYSLDTHLNVYRKKRLIIGISFPRRKENPNNKKKKNKSNNHSSKQFACDICGKTMKYERSVERHKLNFHKETENEFEQDNGDPDEVHSPDGIDDEESNQSSNSVIEENIKSSQSAIPSFMDQQTRQIVSELAQVEQFIKHLLNRDEDTQFTSSTLETISREFDKFPLLITQLGTQGDHLADEWMHRKCSLWDEMDRFKKRSMCTDLELKRKFIMKLMERNGKQELVDEAIEDLKVALDKFYDHLHTQRWKSILLDIRSLYSRFYVEQPNKSKDLIFNSNSKRTRTTKEWLPEALKARLDRLSSLTSSNDIDFIKLDLLVNFLLDVHSHLKSAQSLDRLTDEQLQLVQSVVRTKLPLKMSNIFQNDYLSQCNLVPGQACITLRVLCCFCVNWKASDM